MRTALAVLVVLSGCSTPFAAVVAPPLDAGEDATADAPAPPDAAPDVSPDAGEDVAADAPPATDAAPDVSPDVGEDAPPDVTAESPPPTYTASCTPAMPWQAQCIIMNQPCSGHRWDCVTDGGTLDEENAPGIGEYLPNCQDLGSNQLGGSFCCCF
jgi:hypothetical protein